MRADEEQCKNKFDAFLRQRYLDGDISWRCGDEPPDYYVRLRGDCYAVEVTNLFENIELGDETTSHLGFRTRVLAFLRQIEQKARREGILDGAYVVDYKPLSDYGTQQKKSISKGILEYMRATQGVSSAPEKTVAGSGRLAWKMEKHLSEKRYLTGVTSAAKWEKQAEDELGIRLSEVLEVKGRKLAGISCPKILLIANRYLWVEPADWRRCFQGLSSRHGFHTIFIASGNGDSLVLHSADSAWSSF